VALPARLNVVTLEVADVARATAFYESIGWERSPSSVDGEITFLRGHCVLALWGAGKLAEEADLEPRPPGAFGGLSLSVNVASPDDVDTILGAAEAAGARITVPPRKPPQFDGRHGYFLDPDGHLWEICYGAFPLDDDGTLQLS
jgi:catechol 2,3-dioxygenase-like lactoylglutathione lyase family enzyme